MVDQKASTNKPLVVTLSFLIIVIIGLTSVVIFNLNKTSVTPPLTCLDLNPNDFIKCIDYDELYTLYTEQSIDAVDNYYQKFFDLAKTDAEKTAISINKLIFLISVSETEEAIETSLSRIDLSLASNPDLYKLYLSLNSFYLEKGNEEKAISYYNLAMNVEGVEDLKKGGG